MISSGDFAHYRVDNQLSHDLKNKNNKLKSRYFQQLVDR